MGITKRVTITPELVSQWATIGSRFYVNEVQTTSDGMKRILNEINRKENSLTKSYEICKNTTIYTQSAQGLQSEENEYLEDIMPTLYKIVTNVKRTIDNSLKEVNIITNNHDDEII